MAYCKWTNFVSASCPSDPTSVKNQNFCRAAQGKMDGSEVKAFYEEVISARNIRTSNPTELRTNKSTFSTASKLTTISRREPSPACTNKGNRDLLKFKTSKNKFVLNNTFFRAAQENNMTNLQMCLQSGCNINVQDMFGWTGLMCAVCSGSVECARILLEAGADINLKDKNGRSVWNIAKESSDKTLLKMLRQGGSGDRDKQASSDTALPSSALEPFYCKLCKMTIQQTTRKRHETSTVHLLNCEKRKPPTMYFLPENNVGFRLMLKAGWNKDDGLGPDGTGLKYPVKTVLKRDRKGIGNKANDKARITHFNACDLAAVRNTRSIKDSVRTRSKLSKKQKIQHERREKRKEIEFRRMFH